MSRMIRSIGAALAAALALAVLAGCAGRPSSEVEIAVWQEQERQRLQAQGFPQQPRLTGRFAIRLAEHKELTQWVPMHLAEAFA